jgi:hypothetical protein
MTDRISAYRALKTSLLCAPHNFLSLPTSPARPHIPQGQQQQGHGGAASMPTVASLSLHPALEAALHVLNNDLASAHFLVRHAQSEPAVECMYLHGILHRIEGDVENARCWYGDVDGAEVLRAVWGGGEAKADWRVFLDRVEARRDVHAGRAKGGQSAEEEDVELSRISLWELERLLDVLENMLGLEAMADSSAVWVQPDKEIGEKGNAMIVGGEGWREF